MTLAIALWGAIVATEVGIVQILHRWARRARMWVDQMSVPVMPIGTAPPELGMDVTNLGPEPMSIRTARFRFDAPDEIIDRMHPVPEMAAGFIGAAVFDIEPVVIPPHEIRRLRQPCPGLPCGSHLDFPLRAFVVDAHNRVWWATGPAECDFRWWATWSASNPEGRWPPESTPDVQTDPCQGRSKSAPRAPVEK